jgi:hypothetical protein
VIIAVPAAFAVTTPDVDTVATDVLLDDQVTALFVALLGYTVGVSVCVSPTVTESDVLFKLTLVTGTAAAETVTAQVAVLLPSLVLTVIVALPAAWAVTTPYVETVATEVLLDDQVTDLFVALVGLTVAVKVSLPPTDSERDDLLSVTPVTLTVEALTVTEQFAIFLPSSVRTVTTADPDFLAVTTPEEVTITTEVLLEDHTSVLFVALVGVIVAVSVTEPPSTNVNDCLSRVTPVTGMYFEDTFTLHISV